MQFNEIPQTRAPFLFVEIDNSKALSTPQQKYKVLLLGQGLRSDTDQQPNERELVRITSKKDANRFGSNSMLAAMIQSFFKGTRGIGFDVYAMALSMDSPSVLPDGMKSACGSFTFAGTLTQDTVFTLSFAEVPITITIPPPSKGKDFKLEDLAALVASKINDAGVPVSANVNDKNKLTVDVIFKHPGIIGNGYDLRCENVPGLKISATSLSAGVGVPVNLIGAQANPDKKIPEIQSILENLEQFHLIAFPYPESSALKKMQDQLKLRWNATENLEGMAFTTLSDQNMLSKPDQCLKTFCLNSPYISLIAWNGLSAHYEVCACIIAQIAESASRDPSQSFITLALPGLIPAKREDRFSFKERGDLLGAGLSTLKEDTFNSVRIDRLITTYTGNGEFEDESYLDVNVPLILSFLRYSFKNYWGARFSRAKLSKETPRVRTQTTVVYPNLVKATLVCWYKDMIELGVCQDNLEQFKESITVEIDQSRLNIYIEPELMNQLVGTAVKMAFSN